MKSIEVPGVPKQVTWQQVRQAIAELGIEASRVKSLSLPDARDQRVYVEIYLSTNPLVTVNAEIPIVAGESVSTSENVTPVPVGNPNACRYCGDVIFAFNDGWRHAKGPKGHAASPANIVHLEFGGPVNP